MRSQQNSHPESDFPVGLSAPARRALVGADYLRLDQITELTEAEHLMLNGIGWKGSRILREALAERSLSFKSKR